MSSLLVAIPVWSGDYEQVLLNLQKQIERDGKCRHEAILCFDGLSDEQRLAIQKPAQEAFSAVHIRETTGTPKEPWPKPQNHVWQSIARAIEGTPEIHLGKGWFMWESDALPLKAHWIDTLADAYVKGRKPFMGHIVPDRNHMNAVAVYPFDISTYCTNALLVKSSPFDIALTKEVGLKNITPANHLIAHQLKVKGGDRVQPITKAVLDSLPETTVIIHGYVAEDSKAIEATQNDWKPDYSISILCFNNLELTQRCIESVLKHSNNFELLITDNASTDGTAEYLKALPSEPNRRIKVITNQKNLGFNQPNNHAASIAQGRFFVMLNNDAEVCAGWLTALRKGLNRNVGIVGMAGTCSELSDECRGRPGKLEYVEASCCMMTTDLAREFGPFSSYLKFAYCEDSDLSLRLRESGYNISTVDLPIKHARAATSSKVIGLKEIEESNRREMVKRWGFYLKRRVFDRTVLIRRRGAQGDVLFLTPIIRAMARRWPKATITVQTEWPNILQGHCVETVNNAPMFGGAFASQFDTVFELDLSYEKTPKRHIIDAYADACEIKLLPDRSLEFKGSSNADSKWARQQVKTKPLLLIHAGPTQWPGRDWPPERFDELAKRMRSCGWHVATVGTVANLLVPNTTDLRSTTVGQLYALLRHCSLFVGIDSLPFNLAQAAKTRAFGLFGTINPAYRICSENAIAVHATKAQARCLFAHHEQTPPITKSTCSGECMRAITVQAVLEAIGK